ncbi:TetR/AcrR family transcriptional regulator [Lactococcus termiticola]|uniref:TetR family transcriptional regulator n=1 Tax=Lactococcus termiticola TaxID=2169526 RepID=A0A2R5HKQ6_9LACT|nr:TetR/AcrR family transcriptional regulator [Lactococcus termiticola]GBG97510.1 TetR family transcriptional regulator [Lactococcus termiticola]
MKTKERIIEASKQLICQKGFADTSISDILKAADVGKGQFYYYFASKKVLCLAVIESHVRDWEENCFLAILEQGNDPKQDLSDMIDWVFAKHQDEFQHYGCPVGNLIIELAALDEDYRQPLAQLYEHWTQLIAGKLSQLTGKPVAELSLPAQQMIAAIQGSILLLKLSQDVHVLHDNLEQVKTSYLV